MSNRIRWFGFILVGMVLVSNNLANAMPMKPSVEKGIESTNNPSPKPSQISQTKQKLIRQLVEMTGGQQQYDQMQQFLIAQMQQEVPKLVKQAIDSDSGLTPSQKQIVYAKSTQNITLFIDQFSKSIHTEITYQEVMDRIIYPSYDQYLTEEDLKSLISFYKTTVGKKLISISPQLAQTSHKLYSEVFMPRVVKILGQTIRQQMDSVRTAPTKP